MDFLKRAWDRTKAFFKRSETIFLARAEAFIGFIMLVFASIDWSPVFDLFGTTTDFSWRQVAILGASMMIKGVVLEIARKRNDPKLEKVK